MGYESFARYDGYIQVSSTGSGGWVELPTPKRGSGTIEIQTVVDGGRNANGDMIGQAVGQDKIKLNYSVAVLTDEQLRALFGIFDREEGGSYMVYARYWDPRKGRRVVRQFYVGDRKATPEFVASNGKPAFWRDVECNLIER